MANTKGCIFLIVFRLKMTDEFNELNYEDYIRITTNLFLTCGQK